MQASPEIHLNVEKIKIKDVPTDGDQLQAWLDQQFQKKDRYGLSLAIQLVIYHFVAKRYKEERHNILKKAVIVFIDGNTGLFVSVKASRGIIGCKNYFVFILTMLIGLHTDILINVILNISDCCLISTLWTKTKLASFQERRIICR